MWEQGLLHRTREDGEFVLASGVHSRVRFDCARLTPKDYEILAVQWIHWFYRDRLQPADLFVSVANGGINFAHELARQTDALYGQFNKDASLRGHIINGLRAIVVEDVVTTGLTTQKVIDVLKHQGVKVEGVASLIWRRDIVARPPFTLWPLATYYGD
jgi:orotate phosphoribosyltransferase